MHIETNRNDIGNFLQNYHEMKMKEKLIEKFSPDGRNLIVLVGPSGCGKSTLAKKYEKLGYARISQDEQGKLEHHKIFADAINNHQSIVVDRMNFSVQQRGRYIVPAMEVGYYCNIIVMHESRDTCLERMKARKDHPTIKDETSMHSALNMFFNKYERPQENEADNITYNYPITYKPNAVVCDLDGTLADCSSRLHFVRGEEKNWKKFFQEMDKDTLILPIHEILSRFSWDTNIVLCSGRPETYREQTEKWLGIYQVPYQHLFMRPKNDSRQDAVVKEILLDFEILTRYKPFFILDDRTQVCKMWRRRGYQCLQVAEGDF